MWWWFREKNDKFEERELKSSSPFPAVMCNVDGPNISLSQIVNVAPGEGWVPVFFYFRIGTYLNFLKTFPQDETTSMWNKKFQ